MLLLPTLHSAPLLLEVPIAQAALTHIAEHPPPASQPRAESAAVTRAQDEIHNGVRLGHAVGAHTLHSDHLLLEVSVSILRPTHQQPVHLTQNVQQSRGHKK